MTTAPRTLATPTDAESIRVRSSAPFLGWTLTVLFVTAAIVLNAIVLTWINVAGGQWPQPATIVGIALVFAQQGLVALACGFGRQHFLFRVLLFLASGCLAGMVGAATVGQRQIQGSWIVLLLAHGIVVLCVVWMARANGWRVIGIHDPPAAASPWQFSLARLFALMTSAAIILGIGQQLRVEQRLVGDILILAVLFSATPLVICGLLLSRQSWMMTILAGAGTAWGVGGTLALSMPSPDADFLAWFWVALFHALLILTALSILRLAGYSLSRSVASCSSAAKQRSDHSSD